MNKYNDGTWLKNIYWRLEEYSCVLVLRNKKWFDSVVPKIKELWTIIEKERIDGYDHRKPKKMIKKKEIKEISTNNTSINKCLIEIDTSDLNVDIITDNNSEDKLKDENHKNLL